MNDPENGHQILLNLVNDPVGAETDLSDMIHVELRDPLPIFGETVNRSAAATRRSMN